MRMNRPAFWQRGGLWSLCCCIVSIGLMLPASGQLAYDAQLVGVEEPELLGLLQGVSETWVPPEGGGEDPPTSLLHLSRRAKRDVERFLEVFHSRGYYAATVELELDRAVEPVVLRFQMAPGPQYTLQRVEVVGLDDGFLEPETPWGEVSLQGCFL